MYAHRASSLETLHSIQSIAAYFNTVKLYIDRCAYGKQIFFPSEYIVKYILSLLTVNMYFLGKIHSQVKPVIITSVEFALCPASPYFFFMRDKGNSGLT